MGLHHSVRIACSYCLQLWPEEAPLCRALAASLSDHRSHIIRWALQCILSGQAAWLFPDSLVLSSCLSRQVVLLVTVAAQRLAQGAC